jgi:hypothetical protein
LAVRRASRRSKSPAWSSFALFGVAFLGERLSVPNWLGVVLTPPALCSWPIRGGGMGRNALTYLIAALVALAFAAWLWFLLTH